MTHPLNRYEKVLTEKRKALKGKKAASILAGAGAGAGGGASSAPSGNMSSKKKEKELAEAIFEEWNSCRPRRVSKKRFVEVEVEGVGMVSVLKEEVEEEEKD